MAGFEPTSSRIRSERASQTAPHPDGAPRGRVSSESGWPDSNRRPPASRAGALPKLRHIPMSVDTSRSSVGAWWAWEPQAGARTRVVDLAEPVSQVLCVHRSATRRMRDGFFSCRGRPPTEARGSTALDRPTMAIGSRRARSRIRQARQLTLELCDCLIVLRVRVHDHSSLWDA